MTFEGTVENGQIRLPADVHLPEHAKVYVIVPEVPIEGTVHMISPRLARPEQVADFRLDVVGELFE
jgi:hypothetical protein